MAPQFADLRSHASTLLIELFWRLGEQLGTPTTTPWVDPHTGEQRRGSDDRCAQLRALLRRYPRWKGGHYRLGVASLAQNDIATSYASAQAFLSLTPADAAEAGTGYLLLGQCYLRRGAAAEGIPYLEEARRRLPLNHSVTEELGAAYMASADYPRALALLSSIPATALTPATQAALAFLRSQAASAS